MRRYTRILIIAIMIIMVFLIVINAEPKPLDYKDFEAPYGIQKPKAGMKIRIEHTDNSVSEQWVDVDNVYDALEAYVGDKVTVTDWSTRKGSLKRWDYQYYDGNTEHASYLPATKDGVISVFTLKDPGTHEIYLSVEDNQSIGEYQNWSENGFHRAEKLLDNGQLFYMYFVRQDIDVKALKPPEEDEYLIANISGKSQIERKEDLSLTSKDSLSSSEIVSRTWFKDGEHVGKWDDSIDIDDSLKSTTTYTLKISNKQGLTDIAEHTVVVLGGHHDDSIKSSFTVDKDVNYSNGFLKGYNCNYKDESYVEGHEDDSYRGIERYIIGVYDPNDLSKDRTFVMTKEDIEEEGKSINSVIGSRINKILNGWYPEQGNRLVYIHQRVYDANGNYDGYSRSINVINEGSIITKPRTSISVPYPFYPGKVNGYIENKTIIWSYNHSINIPYKESRVTLYRTREDICTTIYTNKSFLDRQLIIDDGEPMDIYDIEVIVVDDKGTSSTIVKDRISVSGGEPNIKLTLERKTSDLLLTDLENRNPPEIEAIFPTAYTEWNITDASGHIVMEGKGKIDEEIELNDRFSSGVHIATQHAVNSLGNSTYDSKEFKITSDIKFTCSPSTVFEGEEVQIEDLSRAVDNKSWWIVRLDPVSKEPMDELSPLVLSEDMGFTKEKGLYRVILKGKGYFSDYESYGECYKDINFIDATPDARFIIHDYRKMYKQIAIEGRAPSESATSKFLQSKYPILFNDERTLYVIEPMGEDEEPDYLKNRYIMGHDREIVDGRVTFKGRGNISIRIDKDGWYRCSFKTTNKLRDSRWHRMNFYVAKEEPIDLEVKVERDVAYRNPQDSLRVKLRVNVLYHSPDDDELDTNASKLYISYDKNNDGDFNNDESHSNQYYTHTNQRLERYISEVNQYIDGENKKITYDIYIDNPTKNHFGRFRFNYEGLEMPAIPNYIELGQVPVSISDTFLEDDTHKVIHVDNQEPVINIEMTASPSNEIYIIEETSKSFTQEEIQLLLHKLQLNNINPTIYIINRDGKIDKVGDEK